MSATLLRIVRVILAQLITLGLSIWGNVNVPVLNISVGALINGIFKYLRDKFPKSAILEWFPL